MEEKEENRNGSGNDLKNSSNESQNKITDKYYWLYISYFVVHVIVQIVLLTSIKSDFKNNIEMKAYLYALYVVCNTILVMFITYIFIKGFVKYRECLESEK